MIGYAEAAGCGHCGGLAVSELECVGEASAPPVKTALNVADSARTMAITQYCERAF